MNQISNHNHFWFSKIDFLVSSNAHVMPNVPLPFIFRGRHNYPTSPPPFTWRQTPEKSEFLAWNFGPVQDFTNLETIKSSLQSKVSVVWQNFNFLWCSIMDHDWQTLFEFSFLTFLFLCIGWINYLLCFICDQFFLFYTFS